MFKSGTIALIGLPNAGKSTLLNKILGQKLAIVTDKPQTTRKRFKGIYTNPTCQMIFLDTPGVHESEKAINQFMHTEVKQALDDADIICFLIPLNEPLSYRIVDLFERHKNRQAQLMLLLTKVDTPSNRRKIKPDEIAKTFGLLPYSLLSGKTGEGVEDFLKKLEEMLPEGEAHYDEEDLTDTHVRDIAAEMIREKLIELTYEEVPYATAVVINSFKEGEKMTKIDATVIVEHDSQKGIVVGKGGALVKEIASQARKEIETLLSQKVHLDLHVKVDKNWTKNPGKLKTYGY